MSIHHGLRVAAMGAGGTGKSSTAEVVAAGLDIPFLKSVARTVYEERDLTEEKCLQLSSCEKLKLQTEIFDLKIKLDQQYSYVTDRTILDHYVYWLAYCGNFIENDHFLEMEEKVRTLMFSTYGWIFYFPWGYWHPESDGVRQDRFSWQSKIDALLVGYICRWNLPVVHVPQVKGPEYRNEFVLSAIRGELKNVSRES